MDTLKLPLGVSNFNELVTEGYIYCDKTVFIKELLDKGDKVTLITRSRRWGKTLTLSMLKYFFSTEVLGEPTSEIFKNLEIYKLDEGRYINKYQGKFPVIMISFKDIKANNFEKAYSAIYHLVLTMICDHSYILKSDKVDEMNLDKLNKIKNEKADIATLQNSLHLLTRCLYQHYGKKVFIFIDEYDTPLNNAYGNKIYLEELTDFMRGLFSAAFKDNDYLQMGVLTGILRISKDSMLSGLNNVSVYTYLDDAYQPFFGFTENEVFNLLKKSNLESSVDDFKRWFNGYKVGGIDMYNPWSILSCIRNKGSFEVYWLNTGDNSLIEKKILASHFNIKEKFIKLMQKKTISVSINKSLSYDMLDENEDSFWSLLLFAGYLTYETKEVSKMVYECQVKVPNHEIFILYSKVFSDWFVNSFKIKNQTFFLNHLINYDINSFINQLSNLLRCNVSYFDTKLCEMSEGFYHSFVLCMLTSYLETYHIDSNRESGYGRYDILIVPKLQSKAILLELKQVRKEKDLDNAAENALKQIRKNFYNSELMKFPHIKQSVECGIAFCGKKIKAAFVTYDLINKTTSEVFFAPNNFEDSESN